MTGNPVSWFGIHAADLDRAKKFYETVFGETLQEVGGGGMRFMIFGADWAKYGVSGMLWSDGGAVPLDNIRAPCNRTKADTHTLYMIGAEGKPCRMIPPYIIAAAFA